MEYVASISYGKDSLAMLEIIKKHNMPLDRIVHADIMATPTIHADLPPMVEFKDRADKIILERYGLEVERVHSKKSYEEWLYTKKIRGKNVGTIYGFPLLTGAWCLRALKLDPMRKINKPNITQYIGIGVDEPNRFHVLSDIKISPLVEHNITEPMARDICEEIGLLSPIYTQTLRGGCWFCHNQRLQQLRLLRKQYPEYWQLMLKWDKDSPVTFRPDGKTVHDLEERFTEEDLQIQMFWKGGLNE